MGRCLFILNVCLWLLPQPLHVVVTSIFLLLKSLSSARWLWTGSKKTPHRPPPTHTPPPLLHRRGTHHTWPGEPCLSCLYPVSAGCSRFLRHEISVFTLGSASFTSLGWRGSPWKSALPKPLWPGGAAAGASQHRGSSLQEVPLPILPPDPFYIFPLAEGYKHHGAR